MLCPRGRPRSEPRIAVDLPVVTRRPSSPCSGDAAFGAVAACKQVPPTSPCPTRRSAMSSKPAAARTVARAEDPASDRVRPRRDARHPPVCDAVRKVRDLQRSSGRRSAHEGARKSGARRRRDGSSSRHDGRVVRIRALNRDATRPSGRVCRRAPRAMARAEQRRVAWCRRAEPSECPGMSAKCDAGCGTTRADAGRDGAYRRRA